jgi:hypothetical protein
MRKVYLLVYSGRLGTRDHVKACLESIPEVITWRYDLPSAFYLVSEASAATLTEAIRKCALLPNPRFLLTEISPNRQGYLVKDSWAFIRDEANKTS